MYEPADTPVSPCARVLLWAHVLCPHVRPRGMRMCSQTDRQEDTAWAHSRAWLQGFWGVFVSPWTEQPCFCSGRWGWGERLAPRLNAFGKTPEGREEAKA